MASVSREVGNIAEILSSVCGNGKLIHILHVCLPVSSADYLEIVNWSGLCILLEADHASLLLLR